jgi:hypothetical protein
MDLCYLAEREGFEPPIRLPVCRISSAVRSTTLPPLRGSKGRKHAFDSGLSIERHQAKQGKFGRQGQNGALKTERHAPRCSADELAIGVSDGSRSWRMRPKHFDRQPRQRSDPATPGRRPYLFDFVKAFILVMSGPAPAADESGESGEGNPHPSSTSSRSRCCCNA